MKGGGGFFKGHLNKEMIMSHGRSMKQDAPASVSDALQEGARGVAEAGTNVYNAAVEQTREAGRQVQQYVGQKPLYSLGIAAGIGFLLGLYMARR
jgi:ElaB/YqjD/DUF883 family membrane-anchored ribosome-binding protein